MTKSKKYAINGALVGAIFNAIFNAFKQSEEIEKNLGQEFSWKRLLAAAGKGAAIGGIGGFGIGALVDYQNSKIKPIDTNKRLSLLTERIRLDKSDPLYSKLDARAQLLAVLLGKKFGDDIHSMPRLGSTEIGTALNYGFDIDLGVNFRSKTFSSTEEMFFSVFSVFERNIGKYFIKKVRRQKKSIGVFVDVNGEEHKIDIVPCKLTKGGRGSGYLYVNESSLFGKSSYTKTNIKVLNGLKLSPTQKKITIILKRWKEKNNLPMSSHLLQHLILDAYLYTSKIPKGLTAKVIMVLKHISDSLYVAVIRGQENSNNVITNIPESDKEVIIQAANEAVEDYKYQPNSILTTIS